MRHLQDQDNLETTLRTTAARVLGTAHDILDRLDRDQPDLTIPAEDRAVPIDLGRGPRLGVARSGLDGARVALRAAAAVAPRPDPTPGGSRDDQLRSLAAAGLAAAAPDVA